MNKHKEHTSKSLETLKNFPQNYYSYPFSFFFLSKMEYVFTCNDNSYLATCRNLLPSHLK